MDNKKNPESFLVTGGTGSFGKAFISYLLKSNKKIKRLVVFSRDELKQWEMQQKFNPLEFPQLRYFLGDVRDKDRLIQAISLIKNNNKDKTNTIKIVNDYSYENVSEKVVRIILSYRDYVKREVWKNY